MPPRKDRAHSFSVTLPKELAKHYEDKKKELGAGGFAKVILAEHVVTREKVAIKVMNKRYLAKKDDLHRAYNEIYALKNLIHQHICQLYEVFENEEFIYLVIEYCPGGELFDYIVSKKRLNDREARHVFRQIISAVVFIHEQGYAHRDLKPENMLLDGEKNLKIIDFGLAARPEHGLKSPLHTRAGSALYASPELVSGEPYYGNESGYFKNVWIAVPCFAALHYFLMISNGCSTDVWSLGVVLYALLCGFLPFDHENTKELYRKIKNGLFVVPPWLSSKSLSLLQEMLQVNPKKRISIKNILSHEWITSDYAEPVVWQSTFQRNKLNIKIVRLLSEFYKWSHAETEKHVLELKYDQTTAMYFLLSIMSEKKLRKFRNTWLLGVNLTGSRIYNHKLDVPDVIKTNGQITIGSSFYRSAKPDVQNRERSNTMDSLAYTHESNCSLDRKASSSDNRHIRRRSKSMDTINKELKNAHLDSKLIKQHESTLNTSGNSRNRETPIIVTATKPERSYTLTNELTDYVNADMLPERHLPATEKDPHSSNLHPTKRFATSCIDSLNTVHNAANDAKAPQTAQKTKSLNRTIDEDNKEDKRPRTRSMKDFTQRLSGFFKHINGPRRVKAIYHVENTSFLSADDVHKELERVLSLLVSKDILTLYTNVDKYLFKCRSDHDKTKFELEICLIPFMDNVVGIRRKRLKGDAWKYKELVEYILSVARI